MLQHARAQLTMKGKFPDRILSNRMTWNSVKSVALYLSIRLNLLSHLNNYETLEKLHYFSSGQFTSS